MFKVEGRYSIKLTELDRVALDYLTQRGCEHYRRFTIEVHVNTVQEVLELVTRLMPTCNLIFDSVVKHD